MKIKLNYKITSCISLMCLLFGILLGWILFPIIFKSIIAHKLVITPGALNRQLWSKTPFPLEFCIYVFNITNPKEVENGGKPILQEIGPFVFDEWKSKRNLIDNDLKDTVTYNMQNTFVFHLNKSNGLTGNEIISIPHPLIQSIAIVAKRKYSGMLTLVNNSINALFSDETSILTTTFAEIFFNGIFIDCSSTKFAIKALCTAFKMNNIQGITQHNDTHFRFSLLGHTNSTSSGKLTVLRGSSNINSLGEVVSFDDEPQMDVWKGDNCNKLKGSDGTIFPPFIRPGDDIWAFIPEICRSLNAKFVRNSNYSNIPTARYHLDIGNIAEDETLQCFCDNPPNNCPLKGTMNLMSCLEAPFIISLPHFYNGSSQLFENITGLHPNEDKHMGFFEIELITGTPLSAAKRIQFNMDVEPVKEINAMKSIRKMILPMFWIEEKLHLNKTFIDIIENNVFGVLKINDILKYVCIAAGILGLILSVIIFMKYQRQSFNIDKFVLNHTKTNVKNVSDAIADY